MAEIKVGDTWIGIYHDCPVTIAGVEDGEVILNYPAGSAGIRETEAFLRDNYKRKEPQMDEIKVGDKWRNVNHDNVVIIREVNNGWLFYHHPVYDAALWASMDWFLENYKFEEGQTEMDEHRKDPAVEAVIAARKDYFAAMQKEFPIGSKWVTSDGRTLTREHRYHALGESCFSFVEEDDETVVLHVNSGEFQALKQVQPPIEDMSIWVMNETYRGSDFAQMHDLPERAFIYRVLNEGGDYNVVLFAKEGNGIVSLRRLGAPQFRRVYQHLFG